MEAWSGRGLWARPRRRSREVLSKHVIWAWPHGNLARDARSLAAGLGRVLWTLRRGGGTPAAVFPEPRCSRRRFQARVCGFPDPGVDAMVLFSVIGKLLHKRVVLASASPRRREILSNAVRPGPGRGGGRGTEGLNQLGAATQDP
ncbi:hypothetical protein P7K49_037944 [Saguinus oedipus]|uniref:Uncharacterized protein n=1 Tax=Saguinus oedipus TaxID=9490 RepID=A0ABQ9TD88_SAGOE|nr:hypothetical protein P7K49_037944 [Saguinus oedipus]